MSEQTGIEWCDATFNPWWGCERVSPACAHCYADTFAIRLGMKTLWPERPGTTRNDQDVPGHTFRFFGDKHWEEPLKWARTLPGKLGRRPRVFCASMADVFEERDELVGHRVRLYDLILRTPELDWLVLTKRPEFARDWLDRHAVCSAIAFSYALHFENGDPAWDYAYEAVRTGPANVWMGVSIENARYTWRADVLRQIPAAVRFISAEPLLGSLYSVRSRSPRLSFDSVVHDAGSADEQDRRGASPLDLSGIDWVIIGGESGPKARPFHLEHAREIIHAADRCAHYPFPCPPDCSRPAVFVKQLGAKPIDGRSERVDDPRAGSWAWTIPLRLRDRKGGDPDEWPPDLRIREFPRTAVPA